MEQVVIKHYTVADLRQWLEHNNAPEGLSDAVISPSKAWSVIHNPYVCDNDPVVAAIFDHGILATVTGALPEVLVKPLFTDEMGQQKRIWWFYMLWCNKKFRGKGYGLVAIGSLAEIYGEDCVWTAWGVQEATEIFTLLGLKTYYFPRYFMGDKSIHTDSLKGKVAAFLQDCKKRYHRITQRELPTSQYTLRYITYVDDKTYSFITQHSERSFFLSSQQYANWELQYNGVLAIPLETRVKKCSEYFNFQQNISQRYWVQVWVKDRLVGTYMLGHCGDGLDVEYLYYESTNSKDVFTSIAEHIRTMKVNRFETENAQLAAFIRKYIYFPKFTTEQLSLSISDSINVPEKFVR